MNESASDPAGSARERLVAAVERSRGAREPSTDVERMLSGMSIEEAVSEIERRLRDALRRHASGTDALQALDAAALALDAVRLTEDAARLRLAAIAAVEGRELGPGMQDYRLVSRMIASAVDEEVDGALEKAQAAGDLFSLAFDGEGDVFAQTVANGRRHQLEAVASAWRESMLRNGTIVAVGHCRRCNHETILDAELTCPACGKRPRSIDYVAASERPE